MVERFIGTSENLGVTSVRAGQMGTAVRKSEQTVAGASATRNSYNFVGESRTRPPLRVDVLGLPKGIEA